MKYKVLIVSLLMTFLSIGAQEKIDKLSTPPYLKQGDTIAIVAPAGILKDREGTIQKAIELLENWGLYVVLGEHIFHQNNHFAGTDVERAADFQKALDSKSVKAIWSARGGYGSVRILDLLDFTKFKEHPKWIIGYSDITALHNHIHNLEIETMHGMMATSLEEKPEEIMQTISSFKRALFGKELRYLFPSSIHNRNALSSLTKGIEGQMVGGNLSILTSMLGSNSQLSTDGKILFIEEIGEYKYSIDRMLQSLKRAGYFTNVKAVIAGNISAIKKNSTKWGSSIEQLILAVVPKDIPVFFDFPAGHEADNRTIIFGRNVQLIKADENFSLVFKEI